MKKSLFVFFVLLFFLFPGTTTNVIADSYKIPSHTVNIILREDGHGDFEEKITYEFSGTFNGILYDLDLDGTGGAKDLEVFVIKGGEPVPFIRDTSKNPGTYSFKTEDNMVNFIVYEPSREEEKTFVFKYTLLDVVEKYTDTAQFNRKIIGTGWEVPLSNIKIDVVLPPGASRDEIRVFGHGPLTGESRIISGNHVQFTVPRLDPGQFAETRILFPPSLVPHSENTMDKYVLDEIMEQEKVLADEANLERKKAKTRVLIHDITAVVSNIMLILWVYILIKTYIKYDKEHKRSFKHRYYRELPGDYTPGETSILMTWDKVRPADLMATLMDLVRKKALILEEFSVQKKTILGEKMQSEYRYKKSPGDMPSLKEHETFLLDWFVDKVGDGDSFLLSDIKEYARNREKGLSFKSDYDTWRSKVKETALLNDFFDKGTKKGINRTIGIAIIYIIASFLFPLFTGYTNGVSLMFPGIFLIFYATKMKKRTPYGNEQYAKWKAFKRFLLHFGRMQHAEIPSIIIWEHYLVYAVSLGIAKKVIKQLPLVFKENDFKNPGLSYLFVMSQGQFKSFEGNFNRTVSLINSSISQASAVAQSRSSSSSGSGGGFSSGSSGGGGGRGGGGAF